MCETLQQMFKKTVSKNDVNLMSLILNVKFGL